MRNLLATLHLNATTANAVMAYLEASGYSHDVEYAPEYGKGYVITGVFIFELGCLACAVAALNSMDDAGVLEDPPSTTLQLECGDCGNSYPVASATVTTKCPHCGGLN